MEYSYKSLSIITSPEFKFLLVSVVKWLESEIIKFRLSSLEKKLSNPRLQLLIQPNLPIFKQIKKDRCLTHYFEL